MSNSSSSSPQLSVDILHLIAQKMLFTKQVQTESLDDFNIDLRHQNGFTSFMSVNPTTRNVFLGQFTKIKDIVFSGKDPHISMFRDKKKSWESRYMTNQDTAFYGPYLVTKPFVGMLVDVGKLNLSSLESYRFFDENAVIDFAIQSFCKLFLDKELSDEDAANVRFELDITEKYSVLGPIFENILNLNAKEVGICISDLDPKLFDCSLFARTAVAKRTQKFGLIINYSYGYLDDLKENWQEFLGVLLSICPEIRQIVFKITYERQMKGPIDDYVAHLGKMVDMFVRQIFPNLSEGNSDAQISVLLDLNCDIDQYRELLLDDDELFKKGQEIEVKLMRKIRAYKARLCQVADKLGRTHKCEFRILAHKGFIANSEWGDPLLISDVLTYTVDETSSDYEY